MNLHRSETNTQWDSVDEKSWNLWQHLAASTKGVVTPGNLITFAGLFMVLYGLLCIVSGNLWFGLFAIVMGRVCDLLDGLAAEATGTKSSLGELFDAGADKIAAILTLVTIGMLAIIPWPLLVVLLLPHLLIPIIIYSKRRQGAVTHPSRSGKLSMAALWVGVICFLLNNAMAGTQSNALLVIAYIMTIFATVSGFYAVFRYFENPAK